MVKGHFVQILYKGKKWKVWVEEHWLDFRCPTLHEKAMDIAISGWLKEITQ